MIKINFYLKGSIANNNILLLKVKDNKFYESYLRKAIPLLITVSAKGKRVVLPMGVSIAPKFWDNKKRRVKSLTELPLDLRFVNDNIVEAEKTILSDLPVHLNRGKKLSKPLLKSVLSAQSLTNTPGSAITNLNEVLEAFLKERRTSDGHPLKFRSVQKYQGVINHVNRYVNKYYSGFDLHDIDKAFMEGFKDYLSDDLDLLDNSVAKYVKAFKAVVGYLIEKGFKIDPLTLKVKVKEVESPVIVLELAEVMKLAKHKFKSKTLSEVRDLFVFMSWTGQRVSDLMSFSPKQLTTFNGSLVWTLTTVKTVDPIVVPITHYALQILKKYEKSGYALPKFEEQRFNALLKEMATEVGLTRTVPIVERRRGMATHINMPLNEVLSSHIGRKTFITNALILGMSETEVKKISGHKDDKSFRRYVELGNSVIQKANDRLNENSVKAMLKKLSGK